MKDYKMTNFIKVTAAILINDDKLLIAQRKSKDKLLDKWEFPGGKVENGETPEECLKREMKEEFGICVSMEEFLGESVYHWHLELKSYYPPLFHILTTAKMQSEGWRVST